MRRRDDLTIHNERVKWWATTINAVGLGFFALGFARPLIDSNVPLDARALVSLAYFVVSGGASHYVLGRLKTETKDEEDTQ